ncbi:radical SAM protein [Treponema sp.]
MHPLLEEYRNCRLCDRNCAVDRLAANKGFCGETAELRIATASIHKGEEPPISGSGGSGTIFVTGCTLRCSFCQNWQISQKAMGAVVDTELFVKICLALQAAGAENINIVTGSHAIPAIALGLRASRAQGLRIPSLWNTSAYEKVQSIDLLSDVMDVYLPDLKTLDSEISAKYFLAPDYPAVAQAAIRRMVDLQALKFGPSLADSPSSAEDEVLLSGVIIRHLVLPGYLKSTYKVLRWFADTIGDRALLSLMTQYTPVNTSDKIPGRFIEQQEYDTVLQWLEELGIEAGFYQELVPGSDWLPDFNCINPFSSELSKPIWHWSKGFI